MSRFTYFINMNKSSLQTLSAAGGNVDLNIENMPNVFKGVVQKLGLDVEDNRLAMIETLANKYEQLNEILESLTVMKTGYIKDLADGAQKFLSKKVLSFYTDLYKLIDTESSDKIDNLFKVYMYMDTIKVVIDGSLDLAKSIYAISYKNKLTAEPTPLNDTVYESPIMSSEQNEQDDGDEEPVSENTSNSAGYEPIIDDNNGEGPNMPVEELAVDKSNK